MAKSHSPPNNTLFMCAEKARPSRETRNATCAVEFDASIDVSPAAPLDPKLLPALGGVYLLADADDRPIFLGVCENLRRVVPPRLTSEEADAQTKRARLGEIVRRISWKQTRGAFEGLLRHWQFARSVFPDRYATLLGFGPCAFIRIDPDAAFPRFEPVSVIREDTARYFGPIPRRKDAEALIRLLEDAFDLCRYYDILQRTPNGERCAYYDMGRCPAPCDGTAPMSTYRQSIAEAIAFIVNPSDATLVPVRRRMQTAVDALAFETAAAYKRVLDDAGKIRYRTAFAGLADVAATSWIAVIRASVKRKIADETKLKAYCLSNGSVRELAGGRTADIEDLVDTWRRESHEHSLKSGAMDARAVTESLRLLARFLFKDNQRDVLMYPLATLPDANDLREALAPLLDTRRRF
ncbi:MAG: hypothetical protein H6819_02565 [Phycisphaerales bacterium]|nr:hypothetical protein [Phycisphaerales bacterium]MCB9856904.1 hypothetical protein [Phycisphaerales bacterium]MCB9861969.1 hypothetical protein [Phycisphaerales bacterium]